MNGRVCKLLRKLAANPGVPAETSYEAEIHKKQVVDHFDAKGIPVRKVVDRLQIHVGHCHRRYYKFLKGNLKRVKKGWRPKMLEVA